MPMIYENIGGLYAANILELRSWKASRALEICQVSKHVTHNASSAGDPPGTRST